MNRNLQILAGERAYQHIQAHGLQASDIKMLLGASGGPKWFVLSRMDQYISASFLSKAPQPISLVGSSIGAMRMACYAHSEPEKAIQRLEAAYIASSYDETTTPNDVSDSSRDMIQEMLGTSGISDIINNPNRHLNIVTARAKGWSASDQRLRQMAGVISSAAVNVASRRAFLAFYERVIFSQQVSSSPFRDLLGVQGRVCHLSEDNALQALMASGAIPLVLEGVKNILGAPDGMYRDGGLIDYHFDLPFKTAPGLILYPHFAPKLKPGWFDKRLPWRHVNKEHYSDVVLLTPTTGFIDALPYGKIPDRSDFEKLDTATRQRYWHTAIEQGQVLADELDQALAHNAISRLVKPLIPRQLA